MKKELLFLFGMLLTLPSDGQQKGVLPGIAATGARLMQVGSGYGFTEGATVAPDGRIFFTDQPNDRIYVWDEAGGVRLFLEKTGRANGMYYDRRGGLIVCADLENCLLKIDIDGNTERVYCGGYEERQLNGPNDCWQDNRNGIYFTDPYYHRDYWPENRKKEIETEGVYYLSHAGRLSRVIDDLKKPNGIVGTSDGRFLYVADIGAGITWLYEVRENGVLGGKTRFADTGSDGMTLDNHGNVYVTSGRVIVFDSNGKNIGEIELPESPSNLCFGGKDRSILFITAGASVYTLQMQVKGVE